MACRRGGGFTPLRNSEGPPQSCQTQPNCEKCKKLPTPQDVRKKISKILKLPRFATVLHIAMTNKLVVIINSLKVPKMKKILLYEMKFLVQNYSRFQNPWLPPRRSPFSLSSVLNWICWTPPPPEKNSRVRHWCWNLAQRAVAGLFFGHDDEHSGPIKAGEGLHWIWTLSLSRRAVLYQVSWAITYVAKWSNYLQHSWCSHMTNENMSY